MNFREKISESAFNFTDQVLLCSATYPGLVIGGINYAGKLDGLVDEIAYVGGIGAAAHITLSHIAERGVAWVTPDSDWLGDKNRQLLDKPYAFGLRNAIKFGSVAAFSYALARYAPEFFQTIQSFQDYF